MRSHNYGPKFGISTDSLSFTQVINYGRPYDIPGITVLYSTDAQICSNPLGLHTKTQNIVLASTYEDLVTRMAAWSFRCARPLVAVCQRNIIQDLFTPLLVEGSSGEKYTDFTSTCEDCNTDYRAELIEFESGLAFVLTRWINLGSGLSKEDPVWKKHTIIWTPGLDKEHTRMSPRQCFEDMTPISFKELMYRNMSYFKDQRYKSPPFIPYTDLNYDVDGTGYYLPGEPRWESTLTRLTRSLTRLVGGERQARMDEKDLNF
ncbi:hypothetical protein N7528_008647 [Penicillium herquei]|nr:hypothetical protein N7528_008647 [Penicillium herquei]